MNFSQILSSIRYGFAGVARFSGRDANRLFWPWAGFIFLLTQAAAMLVILPAMFDGIVRMAETISREDFARDPAAADQLAAQMMAGLGWLWMPMAVIEAVAILLLAAAVTRRLHDRDRTASWGLLPLPFVAIGLAFMPEAFALGVSPARPHPMLALMYASSALFWGSLLLVGWLLAGAGTDGPNRYGPATRETP
jgi:uncharacterized membrane protein YhaH (DUF805 family)